jgi:hypothetical protein
MKIKQIVKSTRVISTKTKDDEKLEEQTGLYMDYKGDLDDYRKRKKELEDGWL